MDTATAAKATNADKTNSTSHPLFFKSPFPINKDRHAKAGIKKEVNYDFAKNTNSVVLTLGDIAEAARSYPIVMTADETAPQPIAILGIEQKNTFINAQGEWDKQHYVPAYVRRYPFGLAPVPNSEEMALCIDEDAPHFAAKNPDMAFFEDGEPSQLVQSALQFCGRFQQHHDEAAEFGKALQDAGLLAERNAQVRMQAGQTRTIQGFKMIDEQKWHDFANINANDWEQKNFLSLAVLIVASQVNWKYLALRG
jgi:hypothetical protein